MTAFVKRLRAVCRQGGTVYFWNTEGRHYADDPLVCKRWHHHLYLADYGLTTEELAALWGKGFVYNGRIDYDGVEHTPVALAAYMIKEAQEFPGKRAWHCTKRLAQPETETVTVPDSYRLEPPSGEGITVLDDTGTVSTAYGKYRYVEYMVLTDIASLV